MHNNGTKTCINFTGEKLGKILALFPILYLSGGTRVALIVGGGSTSKLFHQIVCGGHACAAKPLTTIELYLIFTSAAVLLSQLPNLNSIPGISLLGAITTIGYCTMMWLVSITKGRLQGVSYYQIVAFAFRGHNVTLEIQATMTLSEKKPSRVPMWRGVQAAYFIEEAMPLVSKGSLQSHVWLRLFLCGGGNPISRKLGWINWWDSCSLPDVDSRIRREVDLCGV